MKSVAMSGSPRASVGKKDARELRSKGQVPCVLYGGEEQVRFAVDEKQFKTLVYTPEVHLVDLEVGGKKHQAIVRELQMHPVTDKIIHVDFLEVVPGKPITVDLPVKFTGSAEGVKAGGKLLRKARKITVRGMVEKIPESIVLDVEHLQVGDVIRVGDVKAEGLSFLEDPNVTIVTVRITRNVEEEAPKAAATTAAPAAGTTPAAAAPAAADAKKAPAKK